MPGMAATLVTLNNALGDAHTNPAPMRAALATPGLSLRAAAESLGAIDALEEGQRDDMRAFLDKFPPGCAAAVFAAVQSALDRGLHVHLTWQPATHFEVRVWDVSDDKGGMVNVFVRSPDPG